MNVNENKQTPHEQKRIESKSEVEAFLQNTKYALEHDARILFQELRTVDFYRDARYSNEYAISTLFPNSKEYIDIILRKELLKLTIGEYIETVKDSKFPDRSDLRVFGKQYNEDDVYIKYRIELFGKDNFPTAFVLSFHFAEKPFKDDDFPYRE